MPAPLRAAFEKVTALPSSSFTLRRIAGARFEAPYHYHPEIELTWIERSSGHRFIGDSVEPFRAGDLVLVGSNLPHVWLNPPACRQAAAIVLQFRSDFLGCTFFDAPELRPVRRLLERSARGLTFSTDTRRSVTNRLLQFENASGPGRVILLLEVLALLAADKSARALCSARYEPRPEPVEGEKINRIFRELTARFRETIFQSELAREVGISPAAFSRFFRRATGRGFTETLNDIRLGYACELLRDTDQTVAEVCYACGFENLANFNRQFRRRHKLSPREWRHRLQDA